MKKLRDTIYNMSFEAHALLLFALRGSCMGAAGAFYLLLHSPLSPRGLAVAGELYSLPKGLLLLAAILCPALEERSRLR